MVEVGVDVVVVEAVVVAAVVVVVVVSVKIKISNVFLQKLGTKYACVCHCQKLKRDCL